MIIKETFVPARPRSDKLITYKKKTYKSQLQTVEMNLTDKIGEYTLDENAILDNSERISLRLLQNELSSTKTTLLSEVASILNSIYLADYHKDALERIANSVVGQYGTISSLNNYITTILSGDGTIPEDTKSLYHKALEAYFASILPLKEGIVGAREAIAAEIKRLADEGSGETQGGGTNELREYDLRFDGKYWNNVGFIEIDMETIVIKKIQFLSDDQNSWADETGRRIVL